MKIRYSFLILLIACSCMENKSPLIIGHRGAMGHETENTIPSIYRALELGVDMIEIDVFKIASGEIVVFHDDTVERLTDGKGNIETYSWEQLQKLTVIGNHKIPLLTEVITVIDRKVSLNIELKGAGTAKEVNRIIADFIQKGWTLEDFVISSFNWEELKLMRIENATIALAVLIENDDPREAIPLAKELKAIAINPDYEKLDLEIANEIRAAGFKIYPWTVNKPEAIEEMKRIGVDGMFTNFPERIK
ncbi:glycerophosphodiester phosphodiesterase [Cellulophaga sp. E16_2]|uniref:Glycerophosphoryl diester phosphodiesterase n=2 Tax=Flavobacteriaceae TaxID=49546 RepID=E6X4K1_CELAD|nr:glycerophosphoryl diester phosphodiesterase [Cellulophaga algicola DSM 14237]MBO0590722.1 glycerophosphodiester phosphodiesterase [Cellulophaga sp. E16_2]